MAIQATQAQVYVENKGKVRGLYQRREFMHATLKDGFLAPTVIAGAAMLCSGAGGSEASAKLAAGSRVISC